MRTTPTGGYITPADKVDSVLAIAGLNRSEVEIVPELGLRGCVRINVFRPVASATAQTTPERRE